MNINLSIEKKGKWTLCEKNGRREGKLGKLPEEKVNYLSISRLGVYSNTTPFFMKYDQINYVDIYFTECFVFCYMLGILSKGYVNLEVQSLFH